MQISWDEFKDLRQEFNRSIEIKKGFFSGNYAETLEASIYTSFYIFPDPINKTIEAYYENLNKSTDLKINEIMENLNAVEEDNFKKTAPELLNLFNDLNEKVFASDPEKLYLQIYEILFQNNSPKIKELQDLVNTPDKFS